MNAAVRHDGSRKPCFIEVGLMHSSALQSLALQGEVLSSGEANCSLLVYLSNRFPMTWYPIWL